MNKLTSTGLITVGLLTSLVVSNVATAQQRVLEEVIVTAQKRAESSQDIPVALTAIGSDTIETLGFNGTQDLTKLSPSLTARVGNSKQNSSFALRGIGTQVFSVGVEQSVAVIIDDVSTVQAGQSIANLIDVERVEILRGPQSTLFGKSASAGVLNIVTKPPAEELEGSIEVSYTDENEERVQGSVSGPITDTLGYRLTGYWSDRDGFVDNLTINDDINDENTKGVRGKLRWDIADTVEAQLTMYYSEEDSTCCALTWLELDPDAMFFGVPEEVAPGITPSDDNVDFRSEDGPEDDTENKGASLRFSADLNEFTLVSITAGDEWDYDNKYDVDLSNVDVQGFYSGGVENGGIYQTSETSTDFFSQEFRLTSPSYEKYDYLLGLYYADADTDRAFNREPILIRADWDVSAGTESFAMFGQVNWRFREATTLTAGLRWNDEEITADFSNYLRSPDDKVKGKESDSEVLGNVSLQHFLLEDAMVYARYAQGYKGQAYDLTANFDDDAAANPVEPETSDSFEIGFKSMLLDGRLQLNGAVFYSEYEDFQAQSLILDENGNALATLNNVGDVETKGVELETIALIGDNLTLNFNVAYIDGEITDYKGATCYAGQTEETGCIDGAQDLEGGELPNSPEWKWNLVADYRLELDSMPFYGFVNVSHVWQDDVQFRLDQNPLTTHDSYGVTDISLGINERDADRYRVTLFVKNAGDENYRSGINDWRQLFGGATSLTNTFARNSQRYYGVRAKFTF